MNCTCSGTIFWVPSPWGLGEGSKIYFLNMVMWHIILKGMSSRQGFSLASAIGHSPKIVPDVRDFAVQFGQFVRDDFRKHTLYGYAQ